MGLSPRVRGSPLVRGGRLRRRDHGSIPACAGKPSGRRGKALPIVSRVYPRVCGEALDDSPDASAIAAAEVYPRVCGEAWFYACDSKQIMGLSPRVRGSRDEGTRDVVSVGSIPACAGKPIGPGRRMGGFGVYPRVCGEALIAGPDEDEIEGLSPRVRGSLCQIFDKGAALFSI